MLAAIRSQAPRVISGIAILAVATVTGLISYQHIENLSLTLHQTILAARLMPFGVDGLITVGSVVLLQGGRVGWLGVVPGVGISLFANVESGVRYGWLAALWAGIPALSFALATFLFERWVSGHATRGTQAVASIPETPQEVAAIETVADAPSTASEPMGASEGVSDPESADAHETAPEPIPDAPECVAVVGSRRGGMTFAEATHEFETEVAAGALPSLRKIQTRAHTGRPRAQQIQTHLITLIDARRVSAAGAPEATRVYEPAGEQRARRSTAPTAAPG